jgi:predicted HTH domain antitoxin
MSITVAFPEELLVATKEDKEVFARRAMMYMLGHLYEQGKISSGVGARIMECDRWTFYHLLTEYGFAVIDYAEEDMIEEAQTSRDLASQRTVQ